MYAIRLPKDLKDKEKAYHRQQAVESYTTEDPANLVGALWGKFNQTAAGRSRHQKEAVVQLGGLTAIRSSYAEADARPFIPSPRHTYFRSTAVTTDVVCRHLAAALSVRHVRKLQDALAPALMAKLTNKKKFEEALREESRRKIEAARRDTAAVKIQCTFKGHLVREQLEDESTTCSLVTRNQIELENKRDSAATTIQSLYRLWAASQVVSSMRIHHGETRRAQVEGTAATFIQRWWLRWR